MRGGLNEQRRADLLERFELDPKKKGRAYSKGNRQKVGLVAALASDAELLILDEPTSGLDPLMEEVFQECIKEERKAGRTVLLSSHILSEVEALCDRVTIIRNGVAVETGTLNELRHLTRTSLDAELDAPPNGLSSLPGVHDLEVDGNRVRCEVDTSQLDAVLRQLTQSGVRSLASHPPTLEALFLRHYQAELPAQNAQKAEAER
jgi:ABC-2 type transport system ATP-binding protein